MLRKTIAVGPLDSFDGTWLAGVAVANPRFRCRLYVIDAGTPCRTAVQGAFGKRCPVLDIWYLRAMTTVGQTMYMSSLRLVVV
jgi:hypothetical protein